MTRITPDDSLFAADDAAVETDAATGAGAMARADAAAQLDQEKCTGCGRDCRLAAPLCELGRDLAQERLDASQNAAEIAWHARGERAHPRGRLAGPLRRRRRPSQAVQLLRLTRGRCAPTSPVVRTIGG